MKTNPNVVLTLAWVCLLVLEPQHPRFISDPDISTSEALLSAAEAAMGTKDARANIRSITAVAKCHGPNGDYETRIISDREGDLYFRQVLSDHQNIEGIFHGRGWQVDENGRVQPIDPIETSALRAREFPIMALDLRRRFHNFKSLGRTEFDGEAADRLGMTHELGHPMDAYFSTTSHLLLGLISTNAFGKESVRIRFDTWRKVGAINLVSHVTIRMGSEAWVFDFQTLELNTANEKTFQPPGSTAVSK